MELKIGKKNSGFTLMEVLVSIAVLSIVSVSLLRVFNVSARANTIASEMDSAKAICIESAESYKNDPSLSPTGYLSSNYTEDSGSYYRYYNRDFDRASASPTEVTGVSAYRVIITPTSTTTNTISDYYYPAPAFTIELETFSGVANLTKLGDSDCLLNGDSSFPDRIIYSNVNGTALIPILVDCKNITGNRTIKVNNFIGKLKETSSSPEVTAIADFYFYNIPQTIPPAMPITVTIDAAYGVSSTNVISLGQQEMIDSSAIIQVERLEDNKILTQVVVDKYWVGEVSP